MSGPSITLAVVLLAFINVPMSISGAAVAPPGIGADLHTAGAPLQWVMNAYNLTFASFMLVTGSAADLVGRRRIFLVGAGLFAAGSLASAAAPGIVLLDPARALLGIGAAGVFASGGAILATTFDGAGAPARSRRSAAPPGSEWRSGRPCRAGWSARWAGAPPSGCTPLWWLWRWPASVTSPNRVPSSVPA
jgi:MFS family permease